MKRSTVGILSEKKFDDVRTSSTHFDQSSAVSRALMKRMFGVLGVAYDRKLADGLHAAKHAAHRLHHTCDNVTATIALLERRHAGWSLSGGVDGAATNGVAVTDDIASNRRRSSIGVCVVNRDVPAQIRGVYCSRPKI